MTATLWDHIRYHAHTRPDAVAVIGSRGITTYDMLVRDIDGLATTLLDLKLSDAKLVGLKLGVSYLHLVLLLALDRLGIPSMSFAPSPNVGFFQNLAANHGLAAIFSTDPSPGELPCRWVQLSNEDNPPIGKGDAARLAQFEQRGDGLIRMIFSSGTTGMPKGIPVTRSIAMNRFKVYQWSHGFSHASRHLCMMRLASGHAYVAMMSILMCGGGLVLPPPSSADVFPVSAGTGVTSLAVLPSLLGELIAASRDLSRRLDGVKTLDWVGGRLPNKMVQETRFYLTHNFFTSYGSTEGGLLSAGNAAMCLADPHAVGYLFPWLSVEVVDEDDRPVAPGSEGMLRVKGETVVAGYDNDEAATARSFRDGWFYPGDIAVIAPDKMLRILGRVDDIVQVDGNKIAPIQVEDRFRKIAGVRDVVVFPVTNPSGLQEIGCALVLAEGADLDQIKETARKALGSRMPARFVTVDLLPRNDNGKVLTRDLVARLANA